VIRNAKRKIRKTKNIKKIKNGRKEETTVLQMEFGRIKRNDKKNKKRKRKISPNQNQKAEIEAEIERKKIKYKNLSKKKNPRNQNQSALKILMKKKGPEK